MKLLLYLLVTYSSISTSRTSLYNLRSNLLSLLEHDPKPSPNQLVVKRIGNEVKIRKFGQNTEDENMSHFRLDPVLNIINARRSKSDEMKPSSIRRKKAQKKLKREIERLIVKKQQEVRKKINRLVGNASQQRKRKTKQLKNFIEMLKAQYNHDRKAVQDVHDTEMIKIDDALKKRLHEISMVNQNIVRTGTFRDTNVVNRNLNRQVARMLVEAYPELKSYINVNEKRMRALPAQDYLDYDVEYGILYY